MRRIFFHWNFFAFIWIPRGVSSLTTILLVVQCRQYCSRSCSTIGKCDTPSDVMQQCSRKAGFFRDLFKICGVIIYNEIYWWKSRFPEGCHDCSEYHTSIPLRPQKVGTHFSLSISAQPLLQSHGEVLNSAGRIEATQQSCRISICLRACSSTNAAFCFL